MKRSISLMMALLLIVGSLWVMASCTSEGETEELTVKPGGKEELTVPSTPNNGNGGSDNNGNNQNGEQTDTPVIQSKEWIIDQVFDASSFQDGIAFVRYRVKNIETEKLELRVSAINKTGKILWELPIGANDDFPEIMNGTLMLNQKTVYDINGKQVASPESHGYDEIVGRSETQFLVHKTEKSFEGNAEYYGVFDSKGEWLFPMTSDLTLAGVTWERCGLVCDNVLFMIKTSEQLGGYYHIDTQQLTPNYPNVFMVKPYSNQPAGIYKCDENGNQTMLLDGYSIANEFGSNFYDTVYICSKEENGVNHYVAVDMLGNILADYGTANNLTSPRGYYNGNLLCTALNPSGDAYYAIVTPEGKLAFDPIPASGHIIDSMTRNPLTEEGFVTYAVTSLWGREFSLHDYKGNVVTFTESINNVQLGLIHDFSCGLALTENGDSKCFIDTTGKIVIDLTKLVIPE